MTTPEVKQCFLGTDKALVAGGDADMSQGSSVFSPFVLLTCLFFPLLSLPLIDKDKANLFGNQGHGWCRQTLLPRAPLRCPFPQYFVFFESIVAAESEEQCEMSGSPGSVKPHSCHTLALLQYISSSRGHDSASAVITTGILIIISTAQCIFHANHNRRKLRLENNEGPI